MVQPLRLSVRYAEPDEDGWIVASIAEVPGAVSQGRTREEARENVLDALRTVLAPDADEADSAAREELDLLPVA